MTMQALSNNIEVKAGNYFETTCRVAPPPAGGGLGKIAIFPGQPRPALYAITRPIYDAAGNVDLDPASSVVQQFDDPGYVGAHTDNQLVRQRDGSFLAMKACTYWKTPANPQPWQALTFQGHKYLRYAHVLWRNDPAQTNWPLQGSDDPFVLDGGRYGHPIDPKASTGNVGSDRPELYACPFTGYVYMTARYLAGAYKDGSGASIDAFDGLLVLYSPNQGKNWYVVESDAGLEFSVPLVMTSTPNGRLFLYQWARDKSNFYGRLYCSNIFRKGGAPKVAEIIGGSDSHEGGDSHNGYFLGFGFARLEYWERANGVPPVGESPKKWPPDPDVDARGCNAIDTPAISRVSTDTATSRVRVSLPALNEHGRNVVAIIDLGVIDTGSGPALEPGSLKRVGRIEAQKQVTHSVLHGTFIDLDPIDTPANFASNASLFYWLEWPGRGRTPEAACATNPQGDLHIVTIDQKGGLWHTIRVSLGCWRSTCRRA